MPQDTQCPLCFQALEVREVAPCDRCGHDPVEIEHLSAGKHTYKLLEIVEGLRLTLCDFCMVDFGSIDASYFGRKRNERIDLFGMRDLRTVDSPCVERDKVCPDCDLRLSFLRFVRDIRSRSRS